MVSHGGQFVYRRYDRPGRRSFQRGWVVEGGPGPNTCKMNIRMQKTAKTLFAAI